MTGLPVVDPMTPAPRRYVWAHRIAVAAMLGSALTYLLTAIAAICNFSFRQILWDQYRTYGQAYLTLKFPASILQLENGHRPILPALVRVAEIEFWHANMLAQIVIGGVLAVATALALALLCWRERNWPRVVRSTGVFVSILGVLWLANARMLLHGNEMLHVYGVALAVVGGTLCVWKSRGTSPVAWAVAASVCATVATFSFGSGIAAFPGLLVVALLVRTRWPVHAVIGVAMAACLALYLFVLPGEEGVRGMLKVQPVDTLILSSRLLASPWVNGWLGLGDDSIAPWLVDWIVQHHPHSLLVGSARLAGRIGLDWQGPAPTIIGLVSLVLVTWIMIRRLLHWERPTAVETVASGLVLFGAATALLIGIGRVDLLANAPSQIFADRYLVWPCLYWLGLIILGLSALSRSVRHGAQFVAPAAGLILAIALFASHSGWAGWAATVSRWAERSAAAARSGVIDTRVFPDDDSASRADVLRTLDLMRQRDLGMFADPTWHLAGTVWKGPMEESRDYQPLLHLVDTFDDAVDGKPGAYLEGWFQNAHGAPKHGWPLALLDSQDRVVGFAQFSFIGYNARPLRLTVPIKKGFDGYIRDYRAEEHYRLISIDPTRGVATVLARLDPSPPP